MWLGAGKASASHIANGVGRMAWLSGAVVLAYSVIRKGCIHHEVRVLDEILVDRQADKQAEIERITRQALSVLSDAVMEWPEQYFWYNKRWVLEPLTPSAE
jgi:lauroyl/myristoyl acyltransferase